jgi:hypothetical protein
MYEILSTKVYRPTPSIAREIASMCGFLVFFAAIFYLAATHGLQKPLDSAFYYSRLSSILGFMATLCLAYEFVTGLRNESNRTRLNQEILQLHHHAATVRDAILDGETRSSRLRQIESETKERMKLLEHEMKYVHRRFFMAWFGVLLAGFATLVQIW